MRGVGDGKDATDSWSPRDMASLDILAPRGQISRDRLLPTSPESVPFYLPPEGLVVSSSHTPDMAFVGYVAVMFARRCNMMRRGGVR